MCIWGVRNNNTKLLRYVDGLGGKVSANVDQHIRNTLVVKLTV